MSQFLQTGKMLYVLAAVCALGIISKLMTGSLYKRMIKETGNMAFTKNKNLRAFRQRMENALLVSPGIRNASAYIEKQLYGFRFLKVSLDSWDNLSVQAMILSFLAGGMAAFGAYWYRLDMSYIVLYGTAGVFSGLLLAFVDNGVGVAIKRQQLSDCLADYMENSPHFYKNADKSQENGADRQKDRGSLLFVRPGARNLQKNGGAAAETAAAAEHDGGLGRPEAGEEGRGEHGDRTNGRFSVLSGRRDESGRTESGRTGSGRPENGRTESGRAENRRAEEAPGLTEAAAALQPEAGAADGGSGRAASASAAETSAGAADLAKSIEQLRKSLEQLAAAREVSQKPQEEKPKERGAKGKKELRAEDLRVIGELLQEYLT